MWWSVVGLAGHCRFQAYSATQRRNEFTKFHCDGNRRRAGHNPRVLSCLPASACLLAWAWVVSVIESSLDCLINMDEFYVYGTEDNENICLNNE